jgi:hypothetical protein
MTSKEATPMNRNFYGVVLTSLLILSFCTLVSLPILQAGYYSDDTINSLIPGAMKLYHLPFWSYIAEEMKTWMTLGRFFPLSIISSISMFYLFPDAYHYQIVRLIFIWAGIFIFAYLIKLISKNFSSAILFLLLLPICWSVRDFADPLTTFAIFLPLVTLFTGLSLIFLLYHQESKKPFWLGLSLIMYLCALLCYEVGVVAFFLILVLIQMGPQTQRQKFHDLTCYLIISLVYLSVYYYLQSASAKVYDGIIIQINSLSLIKLVTQLSSSFPLSYFILSPDQQSNLIAQMKNYLHTPSHILLLTYLFMTVMLTMFYGLTHLRLTKKNVMCFLALGLILMIVPALLMGISQKYQLLIRPGKGYIPVYVQYIGMAFLLLSLLGMLNLILLQRNHKVILQLIVAGIVSLVAIFSVVLNFTVVQIKNEKYYNHRFLLENALNRGLFNSLPAQVDLVEKFFLWKTKEFFLINSTKALHDVMSYNDFKTLYSRSSAKKFYLDEFTLPNTRAGFIAVGHATHFQIKDVNHLVKITKMIQIENPVIYLSVDTLSERNQVIEALRLRFHLDQTSINDLKNTYKLTQNNWIITTLPKRVYALSIQYE